MRPALFRMSWTSPFHPLLRHSAPVSSYPRSHMIVSARANGPISCSIASGTGSAPSALMKSNALSRTVSSFGIVPSFLEYLFHSPGPLELYRLRYLADIAAYQVECLILLLYPWMYESWCRVPYIEYVPLMDVTRQDRRGCEQSFCFGLLVLRLRHVIP